MANSNQFSKKNRSNEQNSVRYKKSKNEKINDKKKYVKTEKTNAVDDKKQIKNTLKSKRIIVKKTKSFNIDKKNQKDNHSNNVSFRLNKYLSNAGVCSRRDADVYIKSGNVSVNGKIITEMGYQVQPNDVVRFDDTTINPETKRYVLLNKPKDYITTLDDEKGRKTVMDLVSSACDERIYPVGRLDRNTTGLLLFTNDGDLAKKLTHPKYNVHKIYHVVLDKKVEKEHLLEILKPDFKIEDIPVFVDEISYIEGSPKNEVGIEIHSGRNRIVRKIFENFGYSVVKLDRVVFAGLTKKDLPKGKFRHLTDKEIINLKNSK